MYIPSSVTPFRAAYMGILTVSMQYSNKSGKLDILGGLYIMGLSPLDYKFDSCNAFCKLIISIYLFSNKW
jgi:hypothetical protein